MGENLRPIELEDLENFQVNEAGELFWKGHRVLILVTDEPEADGHGYHYHLPPVEF